MTMDSPTFRALCIRLADEKDPRKLELLKQRLRLLLLFEPAPRRRPKGKAQLNLAG
jgi:hypothetical protein